MPLLIFFETLAFAWAIALMAVVYREILLREPVLAWWRNIGDQWEDKWWHAPIWGCHKCIAGQLALWAYLGSRINGSYTLTTLFPSYFNGNWPTFHYYSFDVHFTAWGAYSFLGHLFAVCTAILFSELLKLKLDKWI